jgi:ring-1,2-phenylacetyl-CoA epoxidase subunit PaaE
MATPQFHSLQVAQVETITRDSVAITFSVPESLHDVYQYVQGQYLTLRIQLNGEELRRSYSICSAVQDHCLRVAIKRVAGGIFSNWAVEHLRHGSTIDVMSPQGNFYVPTETEGARHIVTFAAGSGITPILSILKTVLLAEPMTCVTLVYGNRSSSGVMFKEELEDLKDRYTARLNLVWVMSRESQDMPLFNGRIDSEKCDQLLTHWIDPASIDAAYICGPEDMMLAASQAMQNKGVLQARIRAELFGVVAGSTQRTVRPAIQGDDQCEVEVVLDGRCHSFTMKKNKDNVVDAGLKAGLEMPYACKGGVCSTCRGKVLYGEVDMDVNFALEDYEVARGFVLCCQSYPVTDKLVINFDEDHAHN